jgi:hypothetical protein
MTPGSLDKDHDDKCAFNGVKVFSATKMRDRDELGDRITAWLREHRHLEIVDKVVTLSSDAEFHCLAITIFYRQLDAESGA